MKWLNMLLPKPKIYVQLGEALLRVVGPQAFLDSVGGCFGKIIIHPDGCIDLLGATNAQIKSDGFEINGFRFSSLILEEPAQLPTADS